MRKFKAVVAALFLTTVMAVVPAFASDGFCNCDPNTQSCPVSSAVVPTQDYAFGGAAVIDLAALTILDMCRFLAEGLAAFGQ